MFEAPNSVIPVRTTVCFLPYAIFWILYGYPSLLIYLTVGAVLNSKPFTGLRHTSLSVFVFRTLFPLFVACRTGYAVKH